MLMSLSNELVEEIWQSAQAVDRDDSTNWRVDKFGSPMLRSEYGNKESPYGWIIQRIRWTAGLLDTAASFHAILWSNV